MINDIPTIEFIEKLGELAKNFGALLVRYAQRLEEQATGDLRRRIVAEDKSGTMTLGARSDGRPVINHIQKADEKP